MLLEKETGLFEHNKTANDIAQVQGNVATMAQAILDINSDIDDLRDQIDGNITTWYYDYDPTLQNMPASEWISQHKEEDHVGDIFYNTDTGYAWRWIYLNNAYVWQEFSDSAATEALAKAREAYDLADNKRRVFFAQPVPPYDEGDLWVQGSGGDILRSTQDRTDQQVYVASDWVLASKYTDNTRAEQAWDRAGTALSSADGKNTVYHSSTRPTGGTYKIGDTWFDSANGYAMYTWNGASWTKEEFGSSAFANLSITNAKIADATIQSGKISGLDVGKLTGGYIDASHINVSTITIGQSQVTNLTSDLSNKANVGANLSTFNNDSSFATTTQVGTAKNEAINTAKADATDKANAAAQTATSFIQADANGIKVAKSVGNATGYAYISANGMQVFENDIKVADFGTSAVLGKSTAQHSVIDSSGQRFYASNGTTLLANIGYGTGTGDSGTSTAPYYTFGTRNSGSTIGNYSFAVGTSNTASGYGAYAEGSNCVASGSSSHASGVYTIASEKGQTAIGKYNENKSDDLFEIGNGGGTMSRSNAFEVDISGNTMVAGKLTAGAANSELITISEKEFTIEPLSPLSATGATTVSISKSGYYPKGVVGFKTGSSNIAYVRCELTSRSSGTATLTYNARNLSTSQTSASDASVKILWLKVTA